MSEPFLQPHAELESAEIESATEIAVINPSIACLQSAKAWQVFLSKDTVVEPAATRLRGVRHVQIPLGWRLSLLRLLSRWFSVRLPDEYEYREVEVERDMPCPVVRAQGGFIFRLDRPCPILSLTLAEYSKLMACRGRQLQHWVEAHFSGRLGCRVTGGDVRRSAA